LNVTGDYVAELKSHSFLVSMAQKNNQGSFKIWL